MNGEFSYVGRFIEDNAPKQYRLQIQQQTTKIMLRNNDDNIKVCCVTPKIGRQIPVFDKQFEEQSC